MTGRHVLEFVTYAGPFMGASVYCLTRYARLALRGGDR